MTQSLDEEKWVNRVTRTDFNVYNSAAFNVMESVQHHEDTLSQQAVDLIAGQPGVDVYKRQAPGDDFQTVLSGRCSA